mmetsp:Transcript_34608/g.74676  ORF Transcript_34608/g.74676 Transcript_34608/m.74676 type:complete len:165 (-) Transcript_34608:102-596(-)
MTSSRLLRSLLAVAVLAFAPFSVLRFAAPPRTKTRTVYYKALTKINIRVSPEVRSLRSGKILEEGQQFQVEDTIEADGQTFLKLTNGDGWVFSKGIAGKWVGKTIAEPLVAQDEGPDSSNEVIKAIKKAIREPLKELERDPAFYAYIAAILGVFVLIFRMFANV